MFDILAEGKRNQTEGLASILESALADPELIADLLKFAAVSQANIAARAIWVVRQISDKDPALLASHKAMIVNELTKSELWEVKAELCHIIPELPLTVDDARTAITFFESCQKDESKIVRAWSLNGLFEVSKIVPEITETVSQLLAEALNSDTASVSARARNILKKMKSAGDKWK